MKPVLFFVQLLIAGMISRELASGQSLNKLNHFVQVQPASSPAATAFREGRDFIRDGEWDKAEARFNRFIAEFPSDREVPAALYWLAYAMKQQDKLEEADRTLVRLLQQYPASTWVNDAVAMRVEMAPRLKNPQVIEQAVNQDDEEIRLAALQSLFEARFDRALPLAAEILKPGANSSRLMKEGAISLLADSERMEAIPILLQAARSEPDVRLRRIAIESLEDFEGAPTLADEVVKLLASEKDPRLQEALVEVLEEIAPARAGAALSELARTSSNPELRRRAIEVLAESEDDAAAAELGRLYDAEKDERIKVEIIEALGESEHPAALQKLMQITRQDPSLRLRKLALSAIAESEDPEAIRFLEELLRK